MRTAKLRQDLTTPHGTYAQGTQVIVRNTTPNKVQLCLDHNGFHIGNKCHAITVPWHYISWVQGPDLEAFHRKRTVRFD